MKTFFLLSTLVFMGVCFAAPVQEHSRIEEDPELTAGYFEGDIVLVNARNGLRNESNRWPNNIVYYYINDNFDEEHRNYILRAMRNIEAVSCVRFEETTPDQKYYVNITSLNNGCHSTAGFQNSVQSVNLKIYPLDSGCFRIGTIMHEFLHTLGFHHMHSAANRDEYVRIVEENIIPVALHNFKKYDHNFVNDFNEEYDYGSIMHYPSDAFSANGKMTIIPLREGGAGIIGQRREMSKSDIKKLNAMYRCTK